MLWTFHDNGRLSLYDNGRLSLYNTGVICLTTQKGPCLPGVSFHVPAVNGKLVDSSHMLSPSLIGRDGGFAVN